MIALGGLTALMVQPSAQGPALPRWWAEVVETVVMVAMVGALGPAIRRFGESFIADVFRSDQDTARQFLNLLDVAYYLVFVGAILVTAQFQGWLLRMPAERLAQEAAERIGTLMLAMGILHSITIAMIPVAGLVLGSVRWRAERGGGRPTSTEARLADLTVRWILGLLVAAIVVGLLVLIVPSVVTLVFGP